MELVYVALPVALLIAGAALAAFVWAARDDQFEDLDTPARRALFEDLPARRRRSDGPGGAPGGPREGDRTQAGPASRGDSGDGSASPLD